jgi:hypothetical protein
VTQGVAGGTDLSRKSRGLPARRKGGDRPPRIRCQICRGKTLPGLDLGHQPVGDLVLSRAELNRRETFYPMQLFHCTGCGLTQLGYTVDPRVVYRNFPFVSGTTQTATRHLQSLPPQLVRMGALTKDAFALDIGSNDGTLLKAYVPFGVRILGVDPSGDPVRIANEQGIPTLHAFFNEETAGIIKDGHGQADAISAAGVFGHIADLDAMMVGVKTLLSPRGIFATDSQYWLAMVERGHYDNMFHQHLRYYAMNPLARLFEKYDMEVFDVERSEVYGGSIRVFAGHRGAYEVGPRVAELRGVEEAARLYDPATCERFRLESEARKRKLFDTVYGLAKQGKKVIGIGAPAKASTVCNYCRLGPDLVEYVTEVNPLRMGKYLPGVHIPIVDEERMFTDPRPADAGILFAWNYRDEIEPKLRARGFQGEIVCP